MRSGSEVGLRRSSLGLELRLLREERILSAAGDSGDRGDERNRRDGCQPPAAE